MPTFDEIVDKTLVKEDIKNTQFMLLIKYRDDYNKTKNEAEKKNNLRNFRKLYKKMKDSLTPDEDEELVKSLSDKMLGIYYEDISEPEPEPEPVKSRGRRRRSGCRGSKPRMKKKQTKRRNKKQTKKQTKKYKKMR